jgi:hypothetical protein
MSLRFDYLDGRDGAQAANEAASEFGLSGRTYIVTGAGRGFGRAMALAIPAADGPLDGILHAAGTQYRARHRRACGGVARPSARSRPDGPARSYSCSPPRPATSPGNCCG